MNIEMIKAMTSLQLRKAVKDAGKDPMADEFSKGDADKMRAFLTALYTPPATTAIQTSSPLRNITSEGLKDHAALQEEHVIELKSNREVTMTVSHKNFDDRITTLELRIATLEQMLKVSNGSVKEIPQPPDQYASLKQYLHDTEDGPELVLTVAQVPALTLEQKLLVLRLLGDTANNGETPPRILNQRIVTALQKMREIK